MTETENTPSPTDRPAPEYGEYAPEGWVPTHLNKSDSVQDPESDPAASTSGAQPSSRGTNSGRAGSFGSSSSTTAQSSGRVPGVPHNLGASGQNPPHSESQPGTKAQPTSAPQQNTTPPPPLIEQQHNGSFIAPIPAAMQPQTGRGRGADRVITILLLVFGALGALYIAASMQQLPASMSTLAAALGSENVAIPDSVSTLGTVGAIVVLAIYALNLIYSIQRLRAHKITFWVPLAAGAIAFIVLFACTSFAMNQVPQVAQLMTDPDAISKLLAYVSETAK